MSATQVQAIREAVAGDFYAAWEPGFTRHVVTTLFAALDAAQAEHAVLVTWLHEALDAGDISLVWQKDCACTHCETDRQRARLMQRGRTSDGALPEPAVAPWWERTQQEG